MANPVDLQRISKIWPEISTGTFDRFHYIRFLTDLESSSASLSDNNVPYATSDIDETLSLLNQIRILAQTNAHNNTAASAQLGLLTRDAVVNTLKQTPQPGWRSSADASITTSLCLALSLRLCIEVSPVRVTGVMIGAVEWQGTSTISEMIRHAFPKPDRAAGPIGGVVSPGTATPNALQPPNAPHPLQNATQPDPIDIRLSLEYLCTYHSFEVIWTGNLKEHLQIEWQGMHHSQPRIMIFEHKIFLWNELRFPTQAFLPLDLVEETIDTLNLLLPYNDYHTAKLLKTFQRHNFYTLGWCGRGRGRPRDLNQYSYFRDQLSELSDIVKTAPTGLPQLKLDRGGRNIMEFLNFWVALLVALFTVFGIAFGTASLVLAKWQYDIAVVQYKLSLAQACATPDAVSMYPQFCSNGTAA